MYLFKLLSAFLKVNLQTALAYRADTVVSILINLMWLGWELLSLGIIFSNTPTLGGWGLGELITLLGMFRLVNTLMMALIWPNTERINTSVRDGSFDYTLLQPVSSLFLVTFTRIEVWRAWNLALAGILLVVGIRMSAASGVVAAAVAAIGPLSLLYFFLLALSGLLVIYSLWIVLIALTFWFTKFDNNVTLLHALLDAGRYPANVYPYWLRLIITFIIPIAVATTVPVQGLRGELALRSVLLYLGFGLLSFLVASQIWKAGLRRYSSASS